MAVRIPRRTRIQTALVVVGMGAFGLLLLGIGANTMRTAADVRLDCVGATGGCELEQHSHFGDAVERFPASRMGRSANTRAGKSTYAVVVTPDQADPGRTVVIGSVSWGEVQAQQAQLDAIRSGGAGDVHLEDGSRWSKTLWPLVWMSIGFFTVVGAVGELRARRRAGHRHRRTADLPPPPAPEHDLLEAQLQQHQLAPLAACVTPWLAEPPVAVGSFVPMGEVRRTGGWPRWVTVAVTPTSIVFFATAFDTHGFFTPDVTYRVERVLASWPLTQVECATHEPTFGTRSLLVQAPGWPVIELADAVYRSGHLPANDLVYRAVPLVVAT